MEQSQRSARANAKLALQVRGALLAITVAILGVFAVAFWIRPYDARDGHPLTIGTHRQIGLPPCTFYRWTGLPCPSCGMTTSFALLVRGDVWNSVRANAVGTLLAAFCLMLVPWNLACALRGRLYLVTSIEWILTRLVIGFLILLLGRWLIVVAMTYFTSH